MEFGLINIDKIDELVALYKAVIEKTKTYGWDESYTSKDILVNYIKSKNMYGVFDNGKIIASAFVGESVFAVDIKCWKKNIKNAGKWARICVHPNYQRKGIGTLFVKFIIQELKNKQFDGIRILVAEQNEPAIKLYNKFNMTVSGTCVIHGINWLCLEYSFK